MRIYRILWTAGLLSISLLISHGQAVAGDVLSLVSAKDKDRPIILMTTGGKVLEKLKMDPGEPSDFTWSPDRRSIAYHSRHGGNLDIYVMDIDKRKHRQLTFQGGKDMSPAWSPDGKWIAFISDRAGDRDIYKMDVNGKNVKQLTREGKCRRPAWSPDSKQIAFSSWSSLHVMDAGGGKPIRLTTTLSISSCSWAPDGKQIAFLASAEGSGIEVFSIGVDGENLRQHTHTEVLTFIFEPVWSPSGEWIAYISTQLPRFGVPVPVNDLLANGVVKIVSPADGHEKSIRATKGLAAHSLSWVPEELFDVAPSAEKLITVWAELKQAEW